MTPTRRQSLCMCSTEGFVHACDSTTILGSANVQDRHTHTDPHIHTVRPAERRSDSLTDDSRYAAAATRISAQIEMPFCRGRDQEPMARLAKIARSRPWVRRTGDVPRPIAHESTDPPAGRIIRTEWGSHGTLRLHLLLYLGDWSRPLHRLERCGAALALLAALRSASHLSRPRCRGPSASPYSPRSPASPPPPHPPLRAAPAPPAADSPARPGIALHTRQSRGRGGRP